MKTPAMKYRLIYMTLLLFVVTQLLFTGCSSIRRIDTQTITTIDISGEIPDLSALESALEQLSAGELLTEPVIAKVPQGFKLPVHLKIDTPLAHMENRDGVLVFDRALYLYVSNQEMLVSPEGDRWTDIANIETVKGLFGGDKGELTVGMAVSQEEGPLLNIALILHPETTGE